MTPSLAYRLALAATIVGALLLVWISLGVGLIGADGDPVNGVFVGLVGVGLVGALLARFRPRGMARTLAGMAVGMAVIAGVALVAGWGQPYSPPLEVAGLSGFFVVLFGAAAWLFGRAEGHAPEAEAA